MLRAAAGLAFVLATGYADVTSPLHWNSHCYSTWAILNGKRTWIHFTAVLLVTGIGCPTTFPGNRG
jgi:hypothetical protein